MRLFKPDSWSKWHFVWAVNGTLAGFHVWLFTSVEVVLIAVWVGFAWEVFVDQRFHRTRDSRLRWLRPDERGFDWGDILADLLGIGVACLLGLTGAWI